MNSLFQSATRFALVVFSLVLSLAFLYVVFHNIHQQDLVTGIVSLFSNVIIAVISFYFGQKGLPSGATQDAHPTPELPEPSDVETNPEKE